jgi:hypothetical protein
MVSQISPKEVMPSSRKLQEDCDSHKDDGISHPWKDYFGDCSLGTPFAAFLMACSVVTELSLDRWYAVRRSVWGNNPGEDQSQRLSSA